MVGELAIYKKQQDELLSEIGHLQSCLKEQEEQMTAKEAEHAEELKAQQDKF